jgi:hypothetical protein
LVSIWAREASKGGKEKKNFFSEKKSKHKNKNKNKMNGINDAAQEPRTREKR